VFKSEVSTTRKGKVLGGETERRENLNNHHGEMIYISMERNPKKEGVVCEKGTRLLELALKKGSERRGKAMFKTHSILEGGRTGDLIV